ncbi:MAG: rhomboid family intramembrane serine protease [Pseudomonadota bacterium]
MVPRTSDAVVGPGPGGWVIIVLILGMGLVEAVILLGGGIGIRPAALRSLALEYGAFWPGLLGSWQANYPAQPAAMFLTYGFLHGSLLHYTVNMITLYSLGRAVILRGGAWRFLAIYGAAILGGAVAFGLLAPDLRPMVGASGALFGLAGAILAWDFLERADFALSLWPVGRAVAVLVLLNLVLWWVMDGLLAWQTHLGGFVAGWAAAVFVEPKRGTTG